MYLKKIILLTCFVISSTVPNDLPLFHESIFNYQHNFEHIHSDKHMPVCYGYEHNCNQSSRYEPDWPHSCAGWEHRKFWLQGDFGYIRQKRDEMMKICHSGYSSLNCTERLQHCQARNLYLNLKNAQSRHYPQHVDDVFNKNEIGGNCEVDTGAISRQDTPNLNGGLRSWFSELKLFSHIGDFNENHNVCDVVIEKPVIFMKWDQGDNMYHRMCNFLNLYLSQHINGSTDFSTDVYIVSWDWTTRRYTDYFSESLEAFTRHSIIHITEWFGKTVCFSSAMFSLLPRMLFGLFYNTPLGDQCWGSGMIQSFSTLFLHRMQIKQEPLENDVTRVTLLVRRSYSTETRTMYRKILNEDKLVEVMKSISRFKVQVVEFRSEIIPFKKQLSIAHNTDILISIHGAGLTHLLFLPDWAVVFELYDCEAKCYKDLARLRGIRHITWQDASKMKKHNVNDNFSQNNLRYFDYSFDPTEFYRLLLEAEELLKKPGRTVHNEL